jgi:hypothetical protein
MGAGLLAVKSGFILFIKSDQFPLQINTLERERERGICRENPCGHDTGGIREQLRCHTTDISASPRNHGAPCQLLCVDREAGCVEVQQRISEDSLLSTSSTLIINISQPSLNYCTNSLMMSIMLKFQISANTNISYS